MHSSQLNIIFIAKLSEFFKRKSSSETSLFHLSVPTLTERLLAQQPFHLGKCSGLFWAVKSTIFISSCGNKTVTVTILMCSCYLFWIWTANASSFNTLGPRRNGRHFADDIFKGIFLNENVWIPIKISLKFVPPINNIPALVQIMAWRRPGDKPLSGPIMVRLPTHICVTQPQWVNYNLGLWFATYFYMLKPEKKYGKHFANGNFKCFFLNEFSVVILFKFHWSSKGSIWQWDTIGSSKGLMLSGDKYKPLPEVNQWWLSSMMPHGPNELIGTNPFLIFKIVLY